MSRAEPNSGAGRRVGYLLRMYPRFTQTFVVNEMLELERQGLDLRIASLRKPTDGVFHESISRVRARADYAPETILSDLGKHWRGHASRVRRHPGRYARALGRAARSGGAAWIDFAQAAWVLRWAKRHRLDHVHVHFGTSEATVALLAHMMGGLSYSLTLHAFDIFRDNVDRDLLVRKINASRFAVTVSDFNRQYLVEHFPGVDPRKIRVNHNGIDLDRFRANGRRREAGSVLAVGRLIEKKGFVHLVRAIGRLRDDGVDVACRIVGDGPEERALSVEIDRLKLAAHVALIGPRSQEDVCTRLRAASCFALPCIQATDGNIDALPTVLLESLASGCPAVSTRISGVPEIIEDGVSGLLVSPGDSDALADAIRRVVQDSSLAARLSRDGRRRAEDRFDVRQNVRVMHRWLTAAGSKPAVEDEAADQVVGRPATDAVGPVAVEAS